MVAGNADLKENQNIQHKKILRPVKAGVFSRYSNHY